MFKRDIELVKESNWEELTKKWQKKIQGRRCETPSLRIADSVLAAALHEGKESARERCARPRSGRQLTFVFTENQNFSEDANSALSTVTSDLWEILHLWIFW